jgi:hypothetical protein
MQAPRSICVLVLDSYASKNVPANGQPNNVRDNRVAGVEYPIRNRPATATSVHRIVAFPVSVCIAAIADHDVTHDSDGKCSRIFDAIASPW